MADRPSSPPPALSVDLSPRELEQIQAVTGPLATDLALPIGNGRGRQFQRFEFLGDSVLDVLLATHAVAEPECPVVGAVPEDVAGLVTDQELASRANEIGLGAWLGWTPSSERLADLAEACIAAAWLSGGWQQAAEVGSRLVHPLGQSCVDALLGSAPGQRFDAPARATARLGSALLELAAGWSSFRAHPDADEGELSRLRAVSHQVARVAAFARRTRPPATGPDSVVSDRVEVWLAEALLEQGADSALAHAEEVLA